MLIFHSNPTFHLTMFHFANIGMGMLVTTDLIGLTLFLSTDSTLTLSRLSGLLQGVDVGDLHSFLDIPESVWRSLSSEADVTTATWQWYLHNHPAPSWIHIADSLYCCEQYEDVRYHTVLEGLKDQVPSLKGESHGVYCASVSALCGCVCVYVSHVCGWVCMHVTYVGGCVCVCVTCV